MLALLKRIRDTKVILGALGEADLKFAYGLLATKLVLIDQNTSVIWITPSGLEVLEICGDAE